jgi:hypothetical protein
MTERMDSAVVRKLIEIGTTGDPLMLLLVTYLGAALHAALFDGVHAFMTPHQEAIKNLLNGPPHNHKLEESDIRTVLRVSRELGLVYRIAIFDSFLNNLTSYALAARPSKGVGRAQMQASVLLGKTRADVVNEYIGRRMKSLSRENFGTRLQALREITDVDIRIPENQLRELKRLSNLRNAIVHEGSAYQFVVDDELRIHSQVHAQTVSMGTENLEVINRTAGCFPV